MRMPGFAGGSYRSQSAMLAGEMCVNVFPEAVTHGNKVQQALVPAPGMSDFSTVGDSPGRGIFAEDDRLFAVFGATIYEIDSAGVATARGTVTHDSNPVTMSTNGDGGEELFITSGGTGYILDLSTDALTSEASAVTQSGQIDGFFVALDTATSTLKISESLDGKTWDPTQIAQRTAASDRWRAMLVARREIYLFGDKTGEVWFNAGNSPFPFAQRPGAFFEFGIAATFSVARFGQSMAWLGRNEHGAGRVYWMNGYTPLPISNAGIEWVIQQYEDEFGISDAIGWSYEREGHQFYVLTFPAAGKTWVYDASTSEWHERGKWSSAANDFVAYRPLFHAKAFGKNLVCDSASNKIYALNSEVYTDVGGDALRRLRRTPHLSDEHRRRFFTYAELECERGVGLAQGQGSDPVVALRYSNNGGKTWSYERTRQVGKRGEYDQRVRWDGCGSGRDRVWEISSSDPVATRWFDFYVGVAA